MNCTGNVNVTCEKCGMNQSIPCSSFNEWDEVSQDQGAAGREVQNESLIEHECTICQNKIEVKASIWTYPDAPGQLPDTFQIDSVDGAEYVDNDCNCN